MSSTPPVEPSSASPAPGTPPSRIGPYRILRLLGEGGMGEVYLAEQTEPVRREVALKIMKLGMDTRQVVARFEAERQSLAVMEHPGIATVLDAGTTEAGRPFFVMERVDGVPITDFCDANRLSVRERVHLFLQVCRAVQHAHQKGVIHRDLKPSNVLVTSAGGEPLCKIIDFGIAKAVEQEGEHLTRMDQAIGTPAYMSPEQAEGSGQDVDTRADIYSLGVLLYELLGGVLPFDAFAYNGWAFVAQVLTREPPSPSDRFAALAPAEQARIAAARDTDLVSLRRALGRDLCWIIAKAMERDRERRYETANGLALDLESFLADQPVLASPPSATYRTRKFVRRHRAGVAFAATLVLLLVGFAATMTVQAERIARARTLAEARQAQAEDLIGFMVGDLSTKLAPIGKLDILDDVGQEAMAYFAAVPEGELSGEELYRRTEVLRQLGQVRMNQGKLDEAMSTFGESLALARNVARRDTTNGEWQVGLGASYFYVGYIHWLQGELDAARAQFVPYLRITERLVAREPDNLDYRQELAYAHGNLGSVQEAKGDVGGALATFQAMLADHRELARRDPSNPARKLDLANAYNSLAVVQRKAGDLDGALANHRAEVALKQALAAREPGDADLQMLLAAGHAYLGNLLLARGDIEGSLNELRETNRLRAALVARDTGNASWRSHLANSERLLGVALVENGEPDAALAPLGSARTHINQLLVLDAENRDTRMDFARTETALTGALLARGERAAALAAARRALAWAEPALREKPEDSALRKVVCEAHLALGDALAGAGDAAGARQAWSRGFAVIDSTARASGDTDLLALSATALLDLDRAEEAKPLLRELARRGYRLPSFVHLVRAKGAMPVS